MLALRCFFQMWGLRENHWKATMSAERPPVQPLPHLTLTYTSSNRRNTLLEVVLASSIASRPEQRLAWPFDVLWWYESIWNTCFEANYYYAPGSKTLQASREKLRVGPNIFSGNSRAVKRWFREIECQEAFETASAWATRRRKKNELLVATTILQCSIFKFTIKFD